MKAASNDLSQAAFDLSQAALSAGYGLKIFYKMC
jgi:hypothetical protein